MGLNLLWGQIFQSQGMVLAMLLLVFALTLSMFGLFNLPAFAWREGSASSSRHGLFLTGMLVTLLATPCSGPLLGGVLGWSFNQPQPVPSFTFFVWAWAWLRRICCWPCFQGWPIASQGQGAGCRVLNWWWAFFCCSPARICSASCLRVCGLWPRRQCWGLWLWVLFMAVIRRGRGSAPHFTGAGCWPACSC